MVLAKYTNRVSHSALIIPCGTIHQVLVRIVTTLALPNVRSRCSQNAARMLMAHLFSCPPMFQSTSTTACSLNRAAKQGSK